MRRFQAFFNPKSVVIIGATDKEESVGKTILENLLLVKDNVTIYAINPKREKVLDIKCYPQITALPEIPELALIATPASTVPDIVDEIGKAGVKSVIIISAGFKEVGSEGIKLESRISTSLKKYGMRILGPNCMGTIRPITNLNTTFTKRIPKAGHVAFLSQSGALGSAVLDWAISKNIGFSAFVSLGSMLDVDFGDLIDFFGEDIETKSIIIYLESISNARKFISSTRGFARSKPIIVIKPGKFQESAQAAKSHTGAMVGEDLHVAAAFARAGVVRVDEIVDLFNCASILNTTKLPKGPNLAIITNAGGPAVLATDALINKGGKLAQLSLETISTLNSFLPNCWSKSNPLDILGDADAQRYTKTIISVVKDMSVDSVLVIYTPQGGSKSLEIAKAITTQAKKSMKPVLTAFMGDQQVSQAKQLFYENNIPAYAFPEEAIKSYLYMYQYSRNLEMLYETPEDIPFNVESPKNYLKAMIHRSRNKQDYLLNEQDSKKFLTTYEIPCTNAYHAKGLKEAVTIAAEIGYPVVMKIFSPDISHKTDIGGVELNLKTPEEVRSAFDKIIKCVNKNNPKAIIEGVTIQRMVAGYDFELILGSKKDPTFGPVILFGYGGIQTELIKDIAVGLPPLNQTLARRLMEQTKIYSALSGGFRNKPPVNLHLLDETLVKLSNLIIDFPEIREIDINPLAVSSNSIVALDARIILDDSLTSEKIGDYSHLVISPYPTRFVIPWRLKDSRAVLLRPIRPEDEPLEKQLITGLSEESSRYRFFHILKDITHTMLTRYCNIDYDREMAIMAEYTADGIKRSVGVSRLIIEPDGQSGEFAVLVADDFQDNGLGLKLSDMLIGIAEERGLKSIYALVLNDNRKMLRLAKNLGFTKESSSTTETRIVLYF
jgi:acetyltransferase